MQIIERLPRETGRHYALRILRWNIINFGLLPGALLSENELAAEMGLSRMPVREALIELSKVKIVEILPQRGSMVSLIDSTLIEEARFMREVLESAIVRLMAETATPEMIAELEDNIRLQEYYLGQDQPQKIPELDREFHKRIYVLTGKAEIYDLMRQMTIHHERVSVLCRRILPTEETVSDHRRIMEAIARHDPDEAERQTKQHLCKQPAMDLYLREQYSAYFKQPTSRRRK